MFLPFFSYTSQAR